MTVLQALILGTLQGLTEFFPVSSSGHLVLGQIFFNIQEEVLLFDICVHLGTLLAVALVFRAAITRLITGTWRGCRTVLSGDQGIVETYRNSDDIRMVAGILLGTVPAVVVGFTLKDQIEGLFHSANAVFAALAFTGCVLLATFIARPGTKRVGLITGIIIGIAQALAITPGISRSGMTISAALFLGIKREDAGEFSFLLSIPAILGATVLAAKDFMEAGGTSLGWLPILTGVVAAFVSGWLALVLLMGLVRRGKMGYFGYYCLAAALAGFLL